jgi:hypothetical protein
MNLYRAFDADPLLLDMNYLSGLFRCDLSEAAERILLAFSEQTVAASEFRLTASPGKITS